MVSSDFGKLDATRHFTLGKDCAIAGMATVEPAAPCERRLWRGEVADPQLDALAAAPAVEAKRAGHVEVAPERFQHRAAERLARGPEGDGVEDGAVAALQ